MIACAIIRICARRVLVRVPIRGEEAPLKICLVPHVLHLKLEVCSGMQRAIAIGRMSDSESDGEEGPSTL